MNSSEFLPGAVESALLDLIAKSHRVRPVSAAKLLNVTRPRLQKAIDLLEAGGFVFLARNPHDSREHVVCLTQKGESEALKAQRAVHLDGSVGGALRAGLGGAICDAPTVRNVFGSVLRLP